MRTSKIHILLLTLMLAACVLLSTGCEENDNSSNQSMEQQLAREQARADALDEDLSVATSISFVSVLVTLVCIALLMRDRSSSEGTHKTTTRKEDTHDSIT